MARPGRSPRRADRQARSVARFAARPGRRAERQIHFEVLSVLIGANLIGAGIVVAIALLLLPTRDVAAAGSTTAINLGASGLGIVLGGFIGYRWALRGLGKARDWLREDRAAEPDEQRAILRAPLFVVRVQMTLWTLAALLFGVLDALIDSLELGLRLGVTIVLGGLGTAAVAYLLTERTLRRPAARALSGAALRRPVAPGIIARTITGWALGTAVPVVGLMLVGLSALLENDYNRVEFSVAVLGLGLAGLIVGFVVTLLSARAAADPVNAVRHALAQVEEGDFDARVPVYDGSELGLLQSGFNRMAEGLAERERIRDLFGRQVGQDVARTALEGEVAMGGEVREVAILFVDIIGSTKIAAARPASEVVELLNEYFAVVISVIDQHGGWINKFEGDAALAVFGAPVAVADPAGSALAAARVLGLRLAAELEGAEAAIGVSFGPAVAGNIGEPRRYEYTVIGDPVNEAARLTELAKEVPARVLASRRIVDAASGAEASMWSYHETATLRGRAVPTELMLPAAAVADLPSGR